MSLCARVVSSIQPQMPLFSIYSLALEQDQEQSVGLQQASTTLHNQTFIQVNFAEICCHISHSASVDTTLFCSCAHCVNLSNCPSFLQPLMQRKQEHEKKRKEIKENWIRAKRKLVQSFIQYMDTRFVAV